jgi:hypothetical protein
LNNLKIEISIFLRVRDEEDKIMESQIVGILGEDEVEQPVNEFCCKHVIRNATYYQR